MTKNIIKGDFSGLACNYSKYRPGYSLSVLKSLLGLLGKSTKNIDFVDVGAGTGIWTMMVNNFSLKSITAIEPNDDMFNALIKNTGNTLIKCLKGTAEKTGLPDKSMDWVTMASSFHWVTII